MKLLWAPWRMPYLTSMEEKKQGCVLCAITAAKHHNRKNHVLLRTKTACVVLNKYPYNSGHLMVVPYRHVSDLEVLDRTEQSDIMRLLVLCKKALDSAFHPQGFNIGINLGRAAGAGIDDHVHAHIVPRWNGDTNFMPALAKTKVISISLDKTYSLLKKYMR